MNARSIDRRRFLTIAGGSALLLGAGLRRNVWAQDMFARTAAPDMIVVNANVYTVDTALPRAEAFAIHSGRFQAVGTNADIRNLARRDTPVFDAQKMTIVPGFIDCHNHAESEILLYRRSHPGKPSSPMPPSINRRGDDPWTTQRKAVRAPSEKPPRS